MSKKGNIPFWELAQNAYEARQDEYYNVIRDCYGEQPYWQARTYKHIAAIQFRGFLTFNYDDQLPDACREVMGGSFEQAFTVYPPKEGDDCADFSDFFIGECKPVFPLHGYCDVKNPNWHKQVILKTEDYDTHYTKPATNMLARFWRALLISSPCIFVGTSLEEPGLYKVAESLKKKDPDALKKHRHLHLVPRDVNRDGTYAPAKKSLWDIEQLRFDKIDSRYTGLIQVLGKISGLPTESPSPSVRAQAPISATTKFNFQA